jgi:class 3 adenylate cyclase
LARYRGTEVDTAGDGFFATFDGPARAGDAAKRSSTLCSLSASTSGQECTPARSRSSTGRSAGSR